MRFLSASALLLAVIATPAFAQDDAPPASETFTGPHAEAIAGWDNVRGSGDSDSGLAYGGAIGFDVQKGPAVFGVEGEVTGSTVEDSGIHAGRDLYAGGRIGYVIGDTTMVYAKGGYTNARVSNIGNFDGYRIGGGVEHSFGRFFGKVEYRYSRYDDAGLNRDQVVAGLGVRF